MKKCLIAAAIFILILGAVTAFLSTGFRGEQKNYGELMVIANEIERLIEKGEAPEAKNKAEELRTALSLYADEEEKNNAYFAAVWIEFGVSAVIIGAVFIYIGLKIIRPFEKLTDFAERIAGGDFDLPLDYERTNYFGKFTWAFDCMRREISTARACEKEAIENNKTVIASLSHDIKTPVASIRAYAEGLEAGYGDNPEKRAKYLEVIMRKCDEVAALTNDMLLHSISDLDRLIMNPTEFELCGFIKETVGEITANKSIRLKLPAYFIEVKADKSRLMQVFENLIGNAAKYARTDVEITALKTEKGAEISFRDFGKGVPEKEIPFLFNKFYRGSRIEKENGAGLGLYIVKYVVTRSGGEVYAENLPDGFRIKIILPTIS
ncbi:MAG: ATP-binding protein [Ruminiclostridium sp.]